MCTPMFPPQQQAAADGRLPEPVRIPLADKQELWVRAVPMPGSEGPSFVYSTVYLSMQSVTVVDPGWPVRGDVEGSIIAPLEEFLRERGRKLADISAVIATHAHPDHLGAAEPLAQAADAKLVMGAREWANIEAARGGKSGSAEASTDNTSPFDLTEENIGAPAGALDNTALNPEKLAEANKPRDLWFFPKQRPDILLSHGDRLDQLNEPALEDFPFEVIHTPGHTDGHICLVNHEQRILIAADQILPTIFPGIGLSVGPLRAAESHAAKPHAAEQRATNTQSANPIADYLDSLQKLAPFDDYSVIPGHGFCFTGLEARRRETAGHVLVRAREVQAIISENEDASVWEIASKITWSAGWEGMLRSPRLASGVKQTVMYRDLVTRFPGSLSA